MSLYSFGLAVAVVVTAPWWGLRMLTEGRYRAGLGERLGRVPAALRGAVRGSRVVWVHAVSVGEVLAASRLVAELEAALGEGWRLVVSTTTATGQALAQEKFGAERVFYLPFDFAWCVRAYLKALRPGLLVLMESELWPRLLHECARAGVPVAVVNARVSDRSFARGRKLRGLWRRAFGGVSLWLAQSAEDARRLGELGAGDVRDVGNLKFDVRAAAGSRVAGLIKDAAAGRPIVVAGSTVASTEAGVEDEEAQVIQAWTQGGLPLDAVLVVAPRHPERFVKTWEYVHHFPSLKATALLSGARSSDASAVSHPEIGSLDSVDIILLDTIGDLAAVYGIADIAYVGGSMFPRGGHNPLEPAQFGVPVVTGESYENFRHIVESMREANAIRIVGDEVELEAELVRLLGDPEEARAMGERGRMVFESQRGATGRTVAALLALVQR